MNGTGDKFFSRAAFAKNQDRFAITLGTDLGHFEHFDHFGGTADQLIKIIFYALKSVYWLNFVFSNASCRESAEPDVRSHPD